MYPTMKLVRAEITDVSVISFVENLQYGQIKQIVTWLLQKAVAEVQKGTLTKGALIDGNYRISS